MIFRAPSYVNEFRCTAGDCRDSCCIGWEIAVDRDTLKKYKKLEGALGNDLRESLSKDGCFILSDNERCPHLLENGLCRIICDAGEEMLCDICREHPRFYNDYGSFCEWGVGLCCESAAELILRSDLPFTFLEEDRKTISTEEIDGTLLSLLFTERERMLSFIVSDDLDVETLADHIEKWATELQKFIDFGDISKECFTYSPNQESHGGFMTPERFQKYRELLLSLEPLSSTWRERCGHVLYPRCLSESSELFKKTLSYFIYRYFLLSALDGDVSAKIGLCLFSAIFILMLANSEGATDLLSFSRVAKDFSKEIEYSEENVSLIEDSFSAFIC